MKRTRERRVATAVTMTVAVLLGVACQSGAEQPSPTLPPPVVQAAPVPHRLQVVTHPQGATVEIRHEGEVVASGASPLDTVVDGGLIEVVVTRDGFNHLVEPVVLDADRALDLWLDPRGLLHHKLGEFPTSAAPKQVAFTPDGEQLWATLLGGDGVEVFDPETGERLAAIALGEHGAVEVIFSGDGTTAYVSQMETASVFEIDRVTLKVRRQLATGGEWSKVMALSPDERVLYVANWSSNDVSEIDLASGTVRRMLGTVGTPRGLYPTADGKRLFVAGFDSGQLARIDLANGKSQMLLDTGGALRHLVGDVERGLLYADDMAGDKAYVVDLTAEDVRELSPTNEKPNTIDLTPDGRVLYVSNRGENGASYYVPGPEWGSVLAIDTATGAVLDAIVGGNQTTGLDVSPDGRLLAFSDFLDNRVQIFAIPPTDELLRGGGGRAKTHLADIPK